MAGVGNRTEKKGRSVKDADSAFLNKALKYPICNMETLEILEGACLKALNERLQLKFKKEKMLRLTAKLKKQPTLSRHAPLGSGPPLACTGKRHTHALDKADEEELKEPPVAKFLPLTPRSIDIPKRLFRNLLSTPPPSSSLTSTPHITSTIPSSSSASSSRFDTEDLPFITHLITQLQANPNSNKGYPLAKSVLSRHFKLIHVLLNYGADPSIKDNMAVMLAIGRCDLEIVRLLIERHEESEHDSVTGSLNAGIAVSIGKKRKRRDGEGMTYASPKKRRLEDRCPVTSDMLELAVKQGSEPLIQFFMSKGQFNRFYAILDVVRERGKDD